MKIIAEFPDRARADSALDLLNEFDPPRRGVHRGLGIHVFMPESWDGNGPVPPGWTGNHTIFVEDGVVRNRVVFGEATISIVESQRFRMSASQEALWNSLVSR